MRSPVKRAVVKKQRKKKIRRQKRRVLKRLPAGTRAITYRKALYYPVGGMYFVRRGGVYVRDFPRGLVVRALVVAPIRLMVRGLAYQYAKGHFYQETDEGYTLVEPPLGAVIPELPEDAVEIENRQDGLYVLEDTFYTQKEDGFEITNAPDGQ